jgi:hypothetical protein
MNKFDLVTDAFFKQLVKKKVLDTIPTKDKDRGEVFNITYNAFAGARFKGNIPYKKMVALCLKHDIDMNLVFKDLS